MQEEELVRRMKSGDRQAFDALYEKYRDSVYRTACLITGNHADGEDVMQETFVKVYLHCRQLKSDKQFRFWLFQILNRTAWQLAGRRKREYPDEHVLEKAGASVTYAADHTILQMEQNSRIWQAVKSLEYRQRTTVVLYYYNELSTRQIAQVMQCMEGTVKSRLYAARKKLRPMLSGELSEGGYLS